MRDPPTPALPPGHKTRQASTAGGRVDITQALGMLGRKGRRYGRRRQNASNLQTDTPMPYLVSHHFRTHSRNAKSGAAVICDLSLDMSSSQIRGRRRKVTGEQYAADHPHTNGARVPWIRPMSWNVGSHENHARSPWGGPPLAAICCGSRIDRSFKNSGRVIRCAPADTAGLSIMECSRSGERLETEY